MKHKNSILICELDTGQLNLYVNGVAIGEIKNSEYKEIRPPDKITNFALTYSDIIAILNSVKREL